ncbi:MAG: carbohydrate ABC transporter permease [Phototrophicales bacterium]|nr:carbohydrate ABC transporter permease [Phototrophicales bacterium]
MTHFSHEIIQDSSDMNRVMTSDTTKSLIRRLIPQRWYAHVVLWIACFFIGFPLFYAMLVSTQNNAQTINFQVIPGESLERNWQSVMVDRNLGRYMVNSVILAVIVTVGKTVLSLLSGLAFVYFRFPGKWVVFGFVLITVMMPTELLIIALFRFVSIQLDWGGTFQALALPFMASATGTFLFRQHFANIPSELSEASQMDGANPLQFLFRVLIPISWNTIGALAVIQFVYVWNMYLWPLLIAPGGADNQVVQVGLRSLLSVDTSISYGPLMLGAVIASLPPVIVFILLQKQFMSGFAITRDK